MRINSNKPKGKIRWKKKMKVAPRGLETAPQLPPVKKVRLHTTGPCDYCAERTGRLLHCSRWSSGHRSFGVKSSTARIRQRIVNRGWIKWAQVGSRVAWKLKMHDDAMLNGVFRICLWLVARQLRILNRYDQSEIAVRLRSSCDPRAARATKL